MAESSDVRVVCLGETMLMLAPPPYELLEYCEQFGVYSGGAESNVAIGLERLGVHAGWIGKLPRHALGSKVVNGIRCFGVDTSRVVWSDEGRVGTFFFQWGAAPRPLLTIYDRAGSAATTLLADELDWDYIARAEWLELTGITPALSPTCRVMAREVAQRARALGVKVAFDVNYRSLLWTHAEARVACEEILPWVNLLVATETDMGMLLGGDVSSAQDSQQALAAIQRRYQMDAVVMTRGGEGCLAYDGREFYQACGHPVQVVNRLGAGDAFVAGLLYGCLQDNLPAGLRIGMAMSALKLTIPQNIPLVDKQDVERLVNGRASDLIR
ncbi:MAG: sugar kinase [Chloroflexi bacterium]|nr:sugar kinase [Chloroflexota bacterium]